MHGKLPRIVVAGAFVAVLTLAVIVVVTLLRQPAPEAPGGATAPETTQAATPSEEPTPTPTLDEQARAVAAAVNGAAEPWRALIAAVRVETVLRRPAVVVVTTLSGEDAAEAESLLARLQTFASGLRMPDGAPYAYTIRILSTASELLGETEPVGDRPAEALPPPPASADETVAWLRAVYGSGAPAPEPWVAAIVSAALDDAGVLVIRTTLDANSAEQRLYAQTLMDAVSSSGACFAPSVTVLFADGYTEWSAMLGGAGT